MTETLTEVWLTILAFLTRLYERTAALVRTLDPLYWGVAGGVLLALLLLWLLLRRRSGNAGRPEVVLSLGTINAVDGSSPDSGPTSSPTGIDSPVARHLLRLTVSNLNPYAVQVLELALKTPEMELPETAEVAAVVPPEGSVVLEHPFRGLAGDEGRINLYFYTAGGRGIYRLQAPFALEPWNNRYKISPLNQSVAPVRQLASTGVSRLQERAWRGDPEGRTPAKSEVREVRAPSRERPTEQPQRSPEPPPRGEREEVFPDEF